MIENIFFISLKKNNEHFAEKSFSVFVEAHGRHLNTLNFFWQHVFLFVCHRLWKIYLSSFQDFFTRISWYYLAMCFLTITHFKLSVHKSKIFFAITITIPIQMLLYLTINLTPSTPIYSWSYSTRPEQNCSKIAANGCYKS